MLAEHWIINLQTLPTLIAHALTPYQLNGLKLTRTSHVPSLDDNIEDLDPSKEDRAERSLSSESFLLNGFEPDMTVNVYGNGCGICDDQW